MSVTTGRKAEVIKTYAKKPGDTGSPEVQVAILSERINNLTEHFKTPRQGQSFAARPAQDGEPAPHAARLPSAHQRTQLQVFDREARHPPLIFCARGECARAFRKRMHCHAFADLSGGDSAADVKRDEKVRPLAKARFERHGRIARRCCSPLRGDARQPLAVLLMAFGARRKP